MTTLMRALCGAFSAARGVANFPVASPFRRALATTGVCALVLAGCNSVTSQNGGGGGDGINDAALGVAASPRVTDQETNLPRGGGRAQVGRPYRIAGQLYTPREDDDYDRTGIASWYGRAFHGRLTANGEVFDMHTLSAAHPTLPLPSYVRVTNTENDHSVIVRVNDRGPFAHDRIIDLSRRAADVLDFRGDGIARVRVQYLERAPLHGQDVAWLEASARIDGIPAHGGDPNVMLASAPAPAPRAAPADAPTPAASIPTEIAFADTSALAPPSRPAATSPVATSPATAANDSSFFDALFGRGEGRQSLTAPNATAAPAATGAPLDLSPVPLARARVPLSAPSAAQSPASTFAPAGLVPSAPVPGAPIPSAALGFMAQDASQPLDLEAGFTQRNRSSLAQTARVDLAHRTAGETALDAARHMALQSRTIARWQAESDEASLAWQPQSGRRGDRQAIVQIGIFGDPSNVERIRQRLSGLGEVVTQPMQSGNRTLTMVRLHAPASDQAADQALLRTLARQGYTDAYLTDAGNS